MNARTLLVVVLVALLVMPTPAAALVRGEPNLEASIAENRVGAGETATLSVTVSNDAVLQQASLSNPSLNAQVTTARGVSVSLESDGVPLTVRTGTRLVGGLPDGTSVDVPFEVRVDEDARPGTYDLDVELEYSYTSQVSELNGAAQTRTETVTRTVRVRVEERARFAVVETVSDVRAGESGRVAVTVENVGRATARDARVTLASGDPALESAGATRFVDRWAPGERRTLEYGVTLAPDAPAASYSLELVPTYRDGAGETVTASSLLVGVTPATDERFAVVGVESAAVAGGSGEVTLTLRNDGNRTVEDATVTLASPTAALAVDGGPATTRFVGAWAPGETRTLAYDVTSGPGTGGEYALEASVAYSEGTRTTVSPTVAVGVDVAGALDVGVERVESDLHVGERGTLRVTVVNDGARPARDAVVHLSTDAPGVTVTDRSVGVGDLAPGASASVEAEVDVASGARPGDRRFSLALEHETAAGQVVRSGPTSLLATVGPDREPLAVEAVNATFEPDASDRLVLRVTNVGETPREAVSVTLAPAPPFTSVAPSAYVPRLDLGESATVAFELSVDEDAVESTHALSVNVSSEAPGSDSAAVDGYRVPVTIREETGGPVDTTTVAIVVLLGVAIAGSVGYWWYRR